jgi:hypothetical protein
MRQKSWGFLPSGFRFIQSSTPIPAYGLRKIFEVYFFLQILLGQGLTAGAVKE